MSFIVRSSYQILVIHGYIDLVCVGTHRNLRIARYVGPQLLKGPNGWVDIDGGSGSGGGGGSCVSMCACVCMCMYVCVCGVGGGGGEEGGR